MNGKGSKSRVTDLKRYKANFEAIEWCNSDLGEFVKRLNEHARTHEPNRIKIGKLFGKKPWPDPMTQ